MELTPHFSPAKTRSPSPSDHLSSLVSDLHSAFLLNKWTLSMSVSADKERIDRGYNVSAIADKLDFISVMTYFFRGNNNDNNNNKTAAVAHHSPLLHAPGAEDRTMNTASAAGSFV